MALIFTILSICLYYLLFFLKDSVQKAYYLQSLSELQVRGFAPPAIARYELAGPIGMLGSGIMQFWANGKICVEDKLIMDNILLKTKLPVFHHSIIPFRCHEQNAIK